MIAREHTRANAQLQMIIRDVINGERLFALERGTPINESDNVTALYILSGKNRFGILQTIV